MNRLIKESLRGQLFIEVLLSLFVLSVIILGVYYILSLAPQVTFYSEKSQHVQNLLTEYQNIAFSFRNRPESLGGNDPNLKLYFTPPPGGAGAILPGEERVSAGGETYARYFYVTNYSTTSSSKIVKIYVTSSTTTEVADVIVGKIGHGGLIQDDWQRGGVAGPMLRITNEFATKTNIATGTILRLQ